MSEPEQEWQDQPVTVESRLLRLERVMLAINDQRTEGFRLAESVDRLGLNAGALQEALLQVDRNQQTLTKLGKELEETKAIVVPREEHQRLDQERQQELQTYRRSLRTRLYGYSLAGVAALIAVGLLLSTYIDHTKQKNFEACVKRNANLEATRDYLVAARNNSTDPALVNAAERVINDLQPVDCETLR